MRAGTQGKFRELFKRGNCLRGQAFFDVVGPVGDIMWIGALLISDECVQCAEKQVCMDA